MNRAHTVWLDQLGSTNATALPTGVALPVFDFGLGAPPTSRREACKRIIKFLWTRKGTIFMLIALWKMVRKLHALSRSRQNRRVLPLHSYFPSFIRSPSTGVSLHTRAWRVPPASLRGRVFLLHGHREHVGRYEPLAARLNAIGFSVFGVDAQGHGRSGGEAGYVESFRHYIQDASFWIDTTLAAEGATEEEDVPVYLFGHGMGATMALQLARIHEWRRCAEAEDQHEFIEAEVEKSQHTECITEECEEECEEEEEEEDARRRASASPMSSPSSFCSVGGRTLAYARTSRIDGLILSSPALIPDAVPPLLQAIAISLADILPRFGVGTVTRLTSLSDEPQTIARFHLDPLVYRGAMSARFGHEMLEAMSDTRQGLPELSLPLLICQGGRDEIISPASAHFLFDAVASSDKTLKMYADARHDLYLDTVRKEFADDVTEWLWNQTNPTQAGW